LDLRNLIDLGGFLEGLQDTRKDIKINEKAKGLNENRPYLLPPLDRGAQGGAAALGGGGTGDSRTKELD
jgi:hypothetical protein